MFSFFLFSFSDVQKKWTFIVSYGGATEEMKLAICFRHEYMWFTYSIDLRTCRKLDNDSSQACESNVRIDRFGKYSEFMFENTTKIRTSTM